MFTYPFNVYLSSECHVVAMSSKKESFVPSESDSCIILFLDGSDNMMCFLQTIRPGGLHLSHRVGRVAKHTRRADLCLQTRCCAQRMEKQYATDDIVFFECATLESTSRTVIRISLWHIESSSFQETLE
jgi:hypothetical protein